MRALSAPLLSLASPFVTTARDCGDYMLHAMLNAPKGASRIGSKGENMGLKNYYGTEEGRKMLWEHTIKETTV